jgi:ribulose-phosphate 3-epimerase
MKSIVEPSILAGDFAHLADEVKRCEKAGADRIHCDVMDGAFVPNLTMGPDIVAAINRSTELPLDVHLMIYNPYGFIEPFVKAGADKITFHIEATENVEETLVFINTCNVGAGLSVCPETSVELLYPYLALCDHILIMTVHPGFGGQSFIPETLEKIRALRAVYKKEIQVDGGITYKTAQQCREAGANAFITGTYLFKSPDMAKTIKDLKAL